MDIRMYNIMFGENIGGVLCGIIDIVALQNNMNHRCKLLYAYTSIHHIWWHHKFVIHSTFDWIITVCTNHTHTGSGTTSSVYTIYSVCVCARVQWDNTIHCMMLGHTMYGVRVNIGQWKKECITTKQRNIIWEENCIISSCYILVMIIS